MDKVVASCLLSSEIHFVCNVQFMALNWVDHVFGAHLSLVTDVVAHSYKCIGDVCRLLIGCLRSLAGQQESQFTVHISAPSPHRCLQHLA